MHVPIHKTMSVTTHGVPGILAENGGSTELCKYVSAVSFNSKHCAQSELFSICDECCAKKKM
jgi:hypothetical protein